MVLNKQLQASQVQTIQTKAAYDKVCSQIIGLGGEKAIDLITLDDICTGETELDDTPHRFHLQEYELPPNSKVTGQLVQVRTNFHNKCLTRGNSKILLFYIITK